MNRAEFYIEREYVSGTWVSAELLFCNGCRRRIRDNQKTETRHTSTKLRCQKPKETMPIVSKSDKNDTRILSPNTSVGELFLYNSKSLKTLSTEETRQLLQNIEDNKKNGHDFSDDINKLVEANMGFIIALALVYYHRAFDKFDANNDYFAELVSIGAIAMHKRLSKRPEPSFEGSVVDRVNYSMNNELMRFAIQEQWGKFSAIPVDYASRYSRYLKCKNKLSIELKRDPTKTEIVGAMIDEKNCTALQALRTIERIAPLAESCLYMATKMYFDDGSNVEFQDTIENDTPSPEQIAIERERYAQLLKAVEKLPEREQKIISLRYGLKDNVFRTLEEVGGELNLTRERIRQIEAVALRKLRHPAFTRGLSQ